MGVQTDLLEVLSRPALDVLGQFQLAVEIEPLGDSSRSPICEMDIGSDPPLLGMLRSKLNQTLGAIAPVEGCRLRLELRRLRVQREVIALLLQGDPLGR